MFLQSASVIGFSGSRRPSPTVVKAVIESILAVPDSVRVHTGCANGVDKLVRSYREDAVVFRVDDMGFSGRGAFAARSIKCVESVNVDGGLWVAFPNGGCPGGINPNTKSSKCFNGSESGTWASLAYAIGLGIPSLMFLDGYEPPKGWGFEMVVPYWFYAAPAAKQLSLLM